MPEFAAPSPEDRALVAGRAWAAEGSRAGSLIMEVQRDCETRRDAPPGGAAMAARGGVGYNRGRTREKGRSCIATPRAACARARSTWK